MIKNGQTILIEVKSGNPKTDPLRSLIRGQKDIRVRNSRRVPLSPGLYSLLFKELLHRIEILIEIPGFKS